MWQFEVEGMSCGHCEKAIRAAIEEAGYEVKRVGAIV